MIANNDDANDANDDDDEDDANDANDDDDDDEVYAILQVALDYCCWINRYYNV